MKLWKNGVFHTMLSEKDIKYQMATHQGYIVGFDQQVSDFEFDEIIDLKGYHIYPGFVDAHLHLLGFGQKLSRPNLMNIKDKKEVVKIIKNAFGDEPLFIEGYFECGLTKIDLNRISQHYPIMIRHNDYHSLTVNDVVLDMINQESSSGILTEQAAQKAMDSYPKHSNQALEKMLENSIKKLNSYGITGGHSDDLYYFNGFKETLRVFDRVLDKMPFRAHLLVHHMVLDEYLKSRRVQLNQTSYLQIGAIKMFYDGTISSKTALLKNKYLNSDSFGMRIHEIKTFESMVKKVRANDLTVAIHVIGDQALLEVLDILKKYPPLDGLHDRLIHTSLMDSKAIEMMKDMPISIDVQPQFVSSDLPGALDYLSETPELVYPWKTLVDHHINIAGSSDAPVEVPNPLFGIYSAVTRISDVDHQVYFKKEALSRFEAIKLYTKYANYSTMDPNRGFLEKGFIADLSIFEENLEETIIENLKKNICYMTVIDECINYKKSY